MQLNGATALLTGATGGLGHAIARSLARRGADLILTGRRGDALQSLAAELGARALACDLGDRAQVEQLIADAGGVDVLVANAALPATGLLAELDQTEIDRMLEVNLRAPIALARGLAPAMVRRGRGHMVFISSLNGLVVTPATSIYAATKFGLRGFALGMRTDLRRDGVGVSVVLPGFVRNAGMFAEADVSLPFGVRTVSPERVGRTVVRVIERNRAEAGVAPLLLRVGSRVGAIAPELAAVANRLAGSDQIAADLAAAHRDKR